MEIAIILAQALELKPAINQYLVAFADLRPSAWDCNRNQQDENGGDGGYNLEF